MSEEAVEGRRRQTVMQKLEAIRRDYAANCGEPFAYFFCPILFKDEEAAICKAHIINQAFPGSSNCWTVQRADVDAFYGSVFEADFTELRHQSPLATSLADGYRGRLNPQVLYKGKAVGFYRPKGDIPASHSQILVGAETKLVLKIEPTELAASGNDDLAFVLDRDLSLPALVSLLKSLHLALFEMLGYKYALSSGGVFLGKTILGSFFDDRLGMNRHELIEKANDHFFEYRSLVRPVMNPNDVGLDTLKDGTMFICEGSGSTRWGLLLFLRTSDKVHAVIAPLLETDEAAAQFVSFLKQDGGKFQARRCKFDGGSFQTTYETQLMDWPPSNFRHT